MNRLKLSGEDIRSIQMLLCDITSRHKSVDDVDFLIEAPSLAHELPRSVRTHLTRFRNLEPSGGVCLISGYPIDHHKIGATPKHWNNKYGVSQTLEEEILFVLFASLLGDVFGWLTQQDGHIIHEVLPIKEYANEQISVGSEEPITWHNEDAFHPYRGDYVGLMCLRNPDMVATTVAPVDSVELDLVEWKILFEPRFVILPDKSHLKENNTHNGNGHEHSDKSITEAFERITQMSLSHEKVPVLYGSGGFYYIRIDPYFMDAADHDEAAQTALTQLVGSIDKKLSEIVLQPGDFCFIDNYKVVHGRRSFHARYDGTDRWLKRINVTRDIRKSRSARASSASRVIL